jgi:hypothetical protein
MADEDMADRRRRRLRPAAVRVDMPVEVVCDDVTDEVTSHAFRPQEE